MSHRAFLERWFKELWGDRRAGIIDECVSENCITHGLPATQHGRASFHGFFQAFSAAFPKIKITVEEVVEQGETVAFHCSGVATDHDGREHSFTGTNITKIRDNQIIEAWNQWDFLAVLESTGYVKQGVMLELIEKEQIKGRR